MSDIINASTNPSGVLFLPNCNAHADPIDGDLEQLQQGAMY